MLFPRFARPLDDAVYQAPSVIRVTLSAAKGLTWGTEMLRCAQHDTTSFSR